MGFFKRREKNQDEMVTMPAADASGIVNELGEAVMNAMETEKPPKETLQALQVGLPFLAQRQLSAEAVLAGQAAARLGYFSRFAEFNRFQAAREADLGLLDALRGRIEQASDEDSPMDTMTEFAAGMVLSEPDRPTAKQGGPLWAVPGMGGDLRLSLADSLMYGFEHIPEDISRRDLLSAWKFGFFLRTLEEFFFEENLLH